MVGIAEPDMPTYEFGCNNCGEHFDHIYQSVPKKMPKTRKCITCGKKASRLISSPTAIKVSGRVSKIGKSNVTQFYNEAIQDSKDRLDVDKAQSPYQRYVPNLDVLTKTGQLKKMSHSEIKQQESKTRKVGEIINNTKSKLSKNKKK
jgi:putative FmdB family regulatory protein